MTFDALLKLAMDGLDSPACDDGGGSRGGGEDEPARVFFVSMESCARLMSELDADGKRAFTEDLFAWPKLMLLMFVRIVTVLLSSESTDE